MMRMPGHRANPLRQPRTEVSEIPAVEGLDLVLAAENVRRQGGDPTRFASALSAGFAEGVPSERTDVFALVSLAGWRAGALTLREDALVRAETIIEPAVRSAATRVLDIRSDLHSFLQKQSTDRYWWPDRAKYNGIVCAIGGFAGVGGSWIAPPTEALPLAEAGAFGIRTDDEWWRADLDVWGVRLVRLSAPPTEDPDAAGSVSIILEENSYLAVLHVEATP